MTEPNVLDLIGLRYRANGTDPRSGVSCLWTARQALARIFADFAPEELPLTPAEEAARLAQARKGLENWNRVGDNAFAATEIGDLLVGEHDNGVLSVAVLVSKARREAITADHEHGVKVVPLRRLMRVRDVFRRAR